jgi:acyl-CoA reductase-like NAD-dependent aldehyde dehydrogenase
MPMNDYPLYLANRPVMPNRDLVVVDKSSGKEAFRTALADRKLVEQGIAAAAEAAGAMRKLPPYERRDILSHCITRFTDRAEELAQSLCLEAGKPIRDSRGEVARLIDTFRVAAEEAVRIGGEVLPLEISPRARGYVGFWKRMPVGPCALITPFNFPLNLAAHKIAPAIAAGCPFVLKPASATPRGALIIGEVLAETSLPRGAFSILPCRHDAAEPLITDDRIRLISFTGSPEVGWDIKARAGKKKVALELGGNAACVVDADSNLEDAVARICFGAFYQSGQSCISVQRILAHQSIYADFLARLVAAVKKLKMGNPTEEDTFIGPLISESDAIRLEQWIASALARGATLLCGGKRRGAFLEPTLLENVPTDEPLSCREAFGPVAVVKPFTDFDEALAEVNDSRYGLQAGLFVRDIHKALRAWDELEVGGVIINDVPSWRVDNMPYGGVKDSGLGREGIRFSIEEMTEIRLMAVRRAL